MSSRKIYFRNSTGFTLYVTLRTSPNEHCLLVQVADEDPGLETNRAEVKHLSTVSFPVTEAIIGCYVDGRLEFEIQGRFKGELSSIAYAVSKKIMPDGPTFLLEPAYS